MAAETPEVAEDGTGVVNASASVVSGRVVEAETVGLEALDVEVTPEVVGTASDNVFEDTGRSTPQTALASKVKDIFQGCPRG